MKALKMTSLQKNAIKLALHECDFSEIFTASHAVSFIIQEILGYQLSKLAAEIM